MTLRPLVVALMLAMSATSSRAEMVAGVDVPETMTVEGQVLHLNGAGVRQIPILGIEIYVAALYLPQQSHDAAAILSNPGPKAVMLHFLHNATKEQVEEEFRKGERTNCSDGRCDPKALPDFELMMQASPAIERGDTALYVYEPARLRVYAGGRLIGDYPNAALSHQMLLGFLGDHPPTERLKRQLLGVAED